MKSKQILFLALAVIVATACNPTYYVPNTQNIPMMSEKGDGNIMVAGNANQSEIQASYGLSNHLGLMLNTAFYRPDDLARGDGGSGNLYELGIGYYTNFSDNVKFGLYGMFGTGNMENHFPSSLFDHPLTTGNISADATRIGIQPNLSFQKNKLSVALSTRVGFLNYSNIQGSLIFENEDQVAYLNDNSSVVIFEPAITVRFEIFKNFNVQGQFGGSFNPPNSSLRQEEAYLTVGLGYSLIGNPID